MINTICLIILECNKQDVFFTLSALDLGHNAYYLHYLSGCKPLTSSAMSYKVETGLLWAQSMWTEENKEKKQWSEELKGDFTERT